MLVINKLPLMQQFYFGSHQDNYLLDYYHNILVHDLYIPRINVVNYCRNERKQIEYNCQSAKKQIEFVTIGY